MADLTGNSGWKSTPNSAIKQRLNWAITKGTSSQNTSKVIVSLWLKKDPSIQNEPTTSTDCRFNIECGNLTATNVQINDSMTLNADNTEMCVARYTFTSVPHNADGTKKAIIKASGGFGGTSISYYTLSISKTVTFPSIARASVLNNIASTVIGNTATFSWTPYSTNFYFRIRLKYGSTIYYFEQNGIENTYHSSSTSTYSVTREIPTELLNEITTATSATMTAYLYTYSDITCTKQIGSVSVKNFTITVPTNLVPTISSFTMTKTNKLIDNVDVISGWGGDINVDGFSKYTFTIVASGTYGSTITSMNISSDFYNVRSTNITDNGDDTYTCVYEGDFVTINATKEVTTTITVQDSRGRNSNSVTDTRYVYGYFAPIILYFIAERDASNSGILNVKTLTNYTYINQNNTIIGTISYRVSGTTEWTLIGSINPNTGETPVTIELTSPDVFEDNYTYELKLAVYDDLGGEAFSETYVGTASVFIDLRAGGNGLGIGKITESDSVEVAFPIKLYSDRLKPLNNIDYKINDAIDSYIYIINNTSLENNFVLYNSFDYIVIRKIGNYVNICGEISSTVDISSSEMSTGKRFLTLADEFIPYNNVYTLCQGSGKNTWLLTINQNGEVIFSRYGISNFTSVTGKAQDESGRVWLPFNVTYMSINGIPANSYYRGISDYEVVLPYEILTDNE